ncbi:protein kinase [Nocardiopsis sp. N85]|uniref:serine/threonine protein kinase n=1 Tax=Nocardiopsis sp. N85 TaxID=3029400 RepID=UPI00237EF33E|nr:protein kinase [Nocardiopsis sp. N85]MDE3722240.1 protein kinase [Nocardiopsis sp. N85]
MGPLENTDPDRIGRYRLIGRLGAGGMGQVFFGRSAGGRAVAIKRVHPHMATDAAFRERFAREVAAARQVSGAFTAPVIDAGPEDEVPWLVTSYVPSLPLDEAVAAHGPLPEPTVRVLAAGLAEALAEIHRVGLIHRDLKPGNVLLAEDGPRVIDFGIARATDGTAATQSVIGTPGFMSPEQVQGDVLTPASDLFAYGAVLAYAASGTGPFGEGSMPTMVMRIIGREPDLAGVPESLRHLVAACLSKDVRGRPTPGEILDYLGDVHAGATWLPPAVMTGVQEQVARVNRALEESAEQTGTHGRGEGAHDPTRVWGAAAAGGAAGAVAGGAAGVWADDQATRVAPGGGFGTPDQGATSVQGQGHAPTRQYGAQQGQGHAPTRQYDAQRPPTADQGAGRDGEDPYADLYGGRRDEVRSDAEELRRREYELHQEQLREQQRLQEQERARQEQYAAQQRRRHDEQLEERRRQEADRAHRERVRAEQEAARRAQAEAREAGRPSLWSFAKLLPLLILPFIQIPLGYGAALAWAWFTTETDVWTGAAYAFEPLSMDGFWHALMLGYFILNNLVSLEFLVRSLRTSFVTGAVLALGVVAATNGLLYSFGFWG